MANESNATVIKWFKPVIEALKALGGSGERKAVQNWIFEHKNDNEVLNPKDVDFARYYLSEGGYIDGPERGVWRLTEKGKSVEMTDNLASKILKGSQKAAAKAKKTPKNTQVEEEHRYWWLNANPKDWSLSNFPVGKIQTYSLYNEEGHKRKIFQNFLNAKAGDMVIGYETSPATRIVAICRVSAEQDGENLFFEKIENMTSPIDLATLKKCPELANMQVFKNSNGSLFKLTKAEYDFIIGMIRKENPEEPKESGKTYDEKKFLEEVFMDKDQYETLVGLVRNKKNVILQGAPGVGKTFAAKRLAYSMMGVKDPNRVMMVQFHQSYSYEDFMMGYKPADKDSFELKEGIFYRFCKKAEKQPDKDFFFIIDEVNRGNMSKIFGELLMLIEKDYRNTPVTLAYKEEQFSVPENLYIIGMMNTADRSLAMIDYALRRRFSFFDMEPAFYSKGFEKQQDGLKNETFNKLISVIKDLNEEILNDKSLGKGFRIGHSYFCGIIDKKEPCNEERLKSIVEYDILPMLREYWFDEPTKVDDWTDKLRSAIK